jgi:hypothetical protein
LLLFPFLASPQALAAQGHTKKDGVLPGTVSAQNVQRKDPGLREVFAQTTTGLLEASLHAYICAVVLAIL